MIVVALWLSSVAAYSFFYPDYLLRLGLDAAATGLFVFLWRRTSGAIANLYRDLGFLHGIYVAVMLFTPIARYVSGAPPIKDTESQSEFYLVAAVSDAVFVLVLAYVSVYAVGKTFLDLRSGWGNMKNAAEAFQRTVASESAKEQGFAPRAGYDAVEDHEATHRVRAVFGRLFPPPKVLAKALRRARTEFEKPPGDKTSR